MDALDLLVEARGHGVVLSLDGDNLALFCDRKNPPADFMELCGEHADELIGLLKHKTIFLEQWGWAFRDEFYPKVNAREAFELIGSRLGFPAPAVEQYYYML